MEIRYFSETDNRMEISRIYEESWKYAYRGIIPQDYLTGNHEPVLHIHEYKRDNFADRKPRLLTKSEYEKYKKYFRGLS